METRSDGKLVERPRRAPGRDCAHRHVASRSERIPRSDSQRGCSQVDNICVTNLLLCNVALRLGYYLTEAMRLSDELFLQLRQLPVGSTFGLHGEFVREFVWERARRRLIAECGRDFVPCEGGYKIVDRPIARPAASA